MTWPLTRSTRKTFVSPVTQAVVPSMARWKPLTALIVRSVAPVRGSTRASGAPLVLCWPWRRIQRLPSGPKLPSQPGPMLATTSLLTGSMRVQLRTAGPVWSQIESAFPIMHPAYPGVVIVIVPPGRRDVSMPTEIAGAGCGRRCASSVPLTTPTIATTAAVAAAERNHEARLACRTGDSCEMTWRATRSDEVEAPAVAARLPARDRDRRRRGSSSCRPRHRYVLAIGGHRGPERADRVVEARAGRADRDAEQSGHLGQRQIDVVVEDEHGTVLQ